MRSSERQGGCVEKLGDLCRSVCSGGTPKSAVSRYYDGGSIPWLNTKEIGFNCIWDTERHITEEGLQESSAKWIPANSVIVAMYGATAAKCCINKIPLTTNQACCNLTLNDALCDYRYIYYYLMFAYNELSSLANGGAQQNLNVQVIKNFQIYLPPLPEQKRIAAILSSLDDKIENNRRINRHLEQMAQALFAQRIGEALDAKGSPDYCQIGDRLRLLNGFAFKSNLFSEVGQYKVITIKNVQDGIVDASECSCVDDCPAAMPHHCRLAIGDVLLSLTGNVGRVGVVSEEKLLLNQRVAKLSPIDSVELPFWYFLFRQAKMKERLIAFSRGTAQSNLSPIETMKLEIRYNRRKVLDYSQLTAPIFSMIVENLRANRSLAELRDSLLPRLMSSRIITKEF